MTQSKIEEVARALFQADYLKERWGEFGPSYADAKLYRRRARAAIEAMREPTDAMCRAPEENRTVGARQSFIAMINRALNENGGEE